MVVRSIVQEGLEHGQLTAMCGQDDLASRCLAERPMAQPHLLEPIEQSGPALCPTTSPSTPLSGPGQRVLFSIARAIFHANNAQPCDPRFLSSSPPSAASQARGGPRPYQPAYKDSFWLFHASFFVSIPPSKDQQLLSNELMRTLAT